MRKRFVLKEHPVWFLDLSYVENSLRTLKSDLCLLGTIGMDIISRYQIRIDYKNRQVTLNLARPFERSRSAAFELQADAIIGFQILSQQRTDIDFKEKRILFEQK